MEGMTTADVLEEMFRFYNEAKERLRRDEPRIYENWKADGFLVDESIDPSKHTTLAGIHALLVTI